MSSDMVLVFHRELTQNAVLTTWDFNVSFTIFGDLLKPKIHFLDSSGCKNFRF